MSPVGGTRISVTAPCPRVFRLECKSATNAASPATYSTLAAAPAVRNAAALLVIHHDTQQAAGTTAAGSRFAKARPVIETGMLVVSR